MQCTDLNDILLARFVVAERLQDMELYKRIFSVFTRHYVPYEVQCDFGPELVH
jgi:hypothetical protein